MQTIETINTMTGQHGTATLFSSPNEALNAAGELDHVIEYGGGYAVLIVGTGVFTMPADDSQRGKTIK